MKKLIYFIATFALLFSSCSQEFTEGYTDQEGSITLNYSLSQSKAGDSSMDELLAKSILRIYKADGELIRYYAPATDMPEELYLVAGSYSASLSVEPEIYATTSLAECAYYGDVDFVVSAGEYSTVDLTSSLSNSAVQIIYDQTIEANFEAGYVTYVAAMDSYSQQEAESNTDLSLPFTESGTGYFVLPEGVSNLSWGFSGTHVNSSVGALSVSGVIENPQAATLYTLTLKYSASTGGVISGITVTVDGTTEDYNDDFTFSPDLLTISALDFSLSEVQSYVEGDSYSMEVVSSNSIESVAVELLDSEGEVVSTHMPLVAGEEVDLSAQGVSYSATNSSSGVVTLSDNLFALFTTGGVKSIKISATDNKSMSSSVTAQFMVSGLLENPEIDLWYNTGALQLCVTTPVSGDVVISYRESNATTWNDATATLVSDNIYQAEFTPTWTESTNDSDSKDKVYSLASGFVAGKTYEYKYSIGGVEGQQSSFTTGGVQTIAYSSLEDSSLSCWTSSNSSSSWWASGNNTFSSKLCTLGTYSGMGGSGCAYLAGASVSLVNLAAGNLFLGQFERPSLLSGQVSFGQSFDWESRPTSFKFKYAASLGTVDATYHDDIIAKGDTDQARIFFAVVDWSSRHEVTSGTSSPSGVWDPATATSVTEGAIIGYASMFITESTTGDMQECDLTVYYYDIETKPSKDITIVISCATSAYGDYMNGSTSSKLYVDDFEFGY